MKRRGMAWVGRHLGVPADASLWLWLYRLFVLPRPAAPDQPQDAASRLQRSLAPLIHLRTRLGRGLIWLLGPVCRPIARLEPRLLPDPVALNARLERLARAPWLEWPLLRGGVFAVAAVVLWLAITTPFTGFEQVLFFLFTLSLALYVRRMPGNLPALLLIGLSVLVSLRYGWWRATQTLTLESPIEKALGWGLLLAEIYTWGILILGFIQTAWPLKRKPVPLPADVNQWPTVDIFVPTYNEPLAVVRPTVLAAKGLDWPAEKLRIYILDDGRREEFREFAAAAGVEYMTRPDNFHAKAGNLNHALPLTHGEFVAIFDCDHIPNRSFLQMTMGWFLQDQRCAMVQTPHHFFSADPFERNLGTFRRIPNEGALFYGLVQDGNDFWDATFFCGSCAILRRGPLMEVGGIAVETVTEDAHTALKLHRRGYSTAYINITQAAGLATESLSGHVGQRIRWARGMAQIFRIDNPFLGKGLTFFQRLCYSNAMLHFFYGIPRLVFLTAPLSFLFFELHIINAMASMIALYVLPHIVHSNIANARIQGPFRHTFWAEVYESVLAWYIALPTTIAFINPRLGKFNVTAKGGLVEESYFDWVISKPYLILVSINLLGFGIGIGRMFFWNTHEQGTVLLNLLWTFYNLLMLGAAVSVATEQRQVRLSHRVPARLPAMLRLKDGRALHCYTEDFSLHGLGLLLANDGIRPGDVLKVSLWRGPVEHVFPARVVVARGGNVGVHFEGLTLEQEAALIQCTFARADIWAAWNNEQDADHPLLGMKEIFMLGLEGYWKLAEHMGKGGRERWQRLSGRPATRQSRA